MPPAERSGASEHAAHPATVPMTDFEPATARRRIAGQMDHSADTTGPSTGTEVDPTRVEDARLVGRALDGDRLALGEIYDRYADRVHTMCLHMLRDHDEAADVCGEVFLVAFQRLA